MNKKGISVIAVVAVMLALSLLGIVAVALLGSVSSLGVDYLKARQAFYIAEAGRHWYLESLQSDNNWSDNATTGDRGPKNFAGGSFVITVSNCMADSITVTSAAVVTGYESQSIQRVVSCDVSRGLPTAFNYAIYVGGSIHTQGAEDFSVTGQQKEGVSDFPTVNFSYYQSIANHVETGAYTFSSGTYTGIWYIDGNVTFGSDVTLNGTVIATGNIDMKSQSNITITSTLPYPALVSDGNYEFNNAHNINITGLVFVGADLSGNLLTQKAEDITFIGSVLVAGNFNAQNSEDMSLIYNTEIASNPPPGFSGGSQNIMMSGWKEVL